MSLGQYLLAYLQRTAESHQNAAEGGGDSGGTEGGQWPNLLRLGTTWAQPPCLKTHPPQKPGVAFGYGNMDLPTRGAEAEQGLGERTDVEDRWPVWSEGRLGSERPHLFPSSGKCSPRQSRRTEPVRCSMGKGTCQVSLGPGVNP